MRHSEPDPTRAAFQSARAWAQKSNYARQKAAEAAHTATKCGNFEVTTALARVLDAQRKIAKLAEQFAQAEFARACALLGAKNPLDEVMAKRAARRAFLWRVY